MASCFKRFLSLRLSYRSLYQWLPPYSQYVQAIYQAQDYAAKNKLKLWSTGDSEYLSKAEGLSVPYEGEGASGNSSPADFVGDDASVSEDVYFRLSI